MITETDLFARNRKGNTIAEKIDLSGDCWVWTAYVKPNGYGTLTIDRRPLLAHRVVWEALVEPIPEGMDIDHLCHNDAVERGECEGGDSCLHRRCVNPDHMEPVTRKENLSRGFSRSSKTECRAGHPYSSENTYIHPRRGHRQCKTCGNARGREYWARKKAEACH